MSPSQEERVATYTVTTRRSRQEVTLERLAAGVYRSGCHRYLYVDRDREGGTELVNHRSGRYAIRRLAQGWHVFDLLTAYEEGDERPFAVYYGGFPETLASAVEDVPRRQAEIDQQVERGAYFRRREPLAVEKALDYLY